MSGIPPKYLALLECPVCFQILGEDGREPHISRCGHTYCRPCGDHDSMRQGPFRTCAVCRVRVVHNVYQLTRSYLAASLIEAVKELCAERPETKEAGTTMYSEVVEEEELPGPSWATPVFQEKKKKRKHADTQEAGEPVSCDHCPDKLSCLSSLKIHVKLEHTKRPKKPVLYCPYCDAVFPSVQALEKHERDIHLHPRHLCVACQQRFVRKSDLRHHERDYHGAPAYKPIESDEED